MNALDAAEEAASHIEHSLPHVWQAICNLSAAIQQVDDRLALHAESTCKKAAEKTEPPIDLDIVIDLVKGVTADRAASLRSTRPDAASYPIMHAQSVAAEEECGFIGRQLVDTLKANKLTPDPFTYTVKVEPEDIKNLGHPINYAVAQIIDQIREQQAAR